MDRHFQRPSARVRTLQTRYASFCSGRVESELAEGDDDDGPGAKGAKAIFIDERFLNGESRSIATMPMLKICTPPPDMYSMNACMGSDLSGEMAKSQAFLFFKSSYAAVALVFALVVVTEDFPPCNLPLDSSAKPGGGGSLLHFGFDGSRDA
jgi:hypothetical protein